MALNSLSFLVFLGIVTAVYYLVPKRAQWIILLIASYSFYLFSGLDHVIYIMGTTLFTFGAGVWMQKMRDSFQVQLDASGSEVTKDQKREMKKALARRIHRVQVFTVLVNLAVLAYVKYMNFLIENINDLFTLFRWDASVPLVNVLVPLGISYYTFNSIGYLIDVGRGKHAAERHLGKFALFVSFFPSIVQGPLFRYCDVGMQLQKAHEFEYNNIKYGSQLLLWGFFKKVVIADNIASTVLTIFSKTAGEYTGSHILFAVLLYSLQIYGDFSGGADIARGAAQMMGIDLPLNFARPFFATSMADFWRRWHMSLGAWMREFVFYPVMLSAPVTAVSKRFRKRFGSYAAKMVPSVAAPLVVFFLIGIWHGLSWQYIVNGLYNAILISSSVALAPVYRKMLEKLKINAECFAFRLFQMLRTFILLCISRIIVKAPSLPEAFLMIKKMFTDIDISFFFLNGEIFSFDINTRMAFMLLVSVIILFTVDILQERGVKIREALSRKCLVVRWGMILGLIFMVLLFGHYGRMDGVSDFIYGNF